MDHKDMDVWKAAMELVEDVYKNTKGFPGEESYGLADRLRRAAVSVPSNIAEGAARNSDRGFVPFLYIALGPAAEIETRIIIAERLGYLKETSGLLRRIPSMRRMLHGLIKHLKKKTGKK